MNLIPQGKYGVYKSTLAKKILDEALVLVRDVDNDKIQLKTEVLTHRIDVELSSNKLLDEDAFRVNPEDIAVCCNRDGDYRDFRVNCSAKVPVLMSNICVNQPMVT